MQKRLRCQCHNPLAPRLGAALPLQHSSTSHSFQRSSNRISRSSPASIRLTCCCNSAYVPSRWSGVPKNDNSQNRAWISCSKVTSGGRNVQTPQGSLASSLCSASTAARHQPRACQQPDFYHFLLKWSRLTGRLLRCCLLVLLLASVRLPALA